MGKYGAKYDKAVDCLAKDREALLTFYDFTRRALEARPDDQSDRKYLRHHSTANRKTKGCLSRKTALAMVFKLAKSAERHWRQLDGSNRLAQVIQGVRFRDGEAVQVTEEQVAA